MKKRLLATLLLLSLLPAIAGCSVPDALKDKSHPWTDSHGVYHNKRVCGEVWDIVSRQYSTVWQWSQTYSSSQRKWVSSYGPHQEEIDVYGWRIECQYE